jgi:hypothetical protein
MKSQQSRDTHIHSKPNNWYSGLCNRWFSLIGVRSKLHSSSVCVCLCYLCCEKLITLSMVNSGPEVRSSGVVHKGIVYALARPDLWIGICHCMLCIPQNVTFKWVALYSWVPRFKSWPSGRLSLLILMFFFLSLFQ